MGHLFEPFVSTKRSGSGLGLSLVAKIVGDHGGVVEFESPARGTLFRVRLPAWRSARAGRATGAGMAEPTVILADDDGGSAP